MLDEARVRVGASAIIASVIHPHFPGVGGGLDLTPIRIALRPCCVIADEQEVILFLRCRGHMYLFVSLNVRFVFEETFSNFSHVAICPHMVAIIESDDGCINVINEIIYPFCSSNLPESGSSYKSTPPSSASS